MIEASGDKGFAKRMVETWRTKPLIGYVLEDLDTRVKKDRAVKLSVLATGLSAFLEQPINLFLKGESGIGKTYNVTETLKYFPQEDIWFLGGMSQKSLIHAHGKLLNKDGEEIDLENRPVKPSKRDFETEADYKEAITQYQDQTKGFREELKESYTLIDLSHKILVFLEAPDFGTYQMLRPILSHDKEEIQYQFVDKTAKGQLRTMKVILKGWPATIFLTTDNRYMEELATRSFTATPESSELKILEANVLTNFKASLPWQYSEETEAFTIIKRLIESLQKNTLESKIDVVIPFLNLYELFPKEISRDMRDFQHFTQFLKTVTLLHYFQRPYMKIGESRFLLSTLEDVHKGLEVYKEIFETTRTGTEKRILDFYHNIVKTRPITTFIDEKEEPVKDKDGKPTVDDNPSWYLSQLTTHYNKTARKKLSEESIRVMLSRLDKIGYVNTQKDDEDKRKNLYVPLIKGEEKDKNPLENCSWQDSKTELEKGFEKWKKNVLGKYAFYINKNISGKEGEWGETEATLEDLHKLIIEQNIFSSNAEQGSTRTFSNGDLKLKAENKLETSLKPESRRNLDNPLGQEVESE